MDSSIWKKNHKRVTVKIKCIDLMVTALVPSSIKMVSAFIIFMFIKIMVENSSFLKHYKNRTSIQYKRFFKVLSSMTNFKLNGWSDILLLV
jgi:hypothetical protein